MYFLHGVHVFDGRWFVIRSEQFLDLISYRVRRGTKMYPSTLQELLHTPCLEFLRLLDCFSCSRRCREGRSVGGVRRNRGGFRKTLVPVGSVFRHFFFSPTCQLVSGVEYHRDTHRRAWVQYVVLFVEERQLLCEKISLARLQWQSPLSWIRETRTVKRKDDRSPPCVATR